MIKIIAFGDSTVHGYSGPGGPSIPTQTWPYRLMVRLGETPVESYADVIMNGYGDQGGFAPPSEGNTLTGVNYTMFNSGVNGENTVQLQSRFQTVIRTLNPDIAIFSTGVNDLGIMGGTGEYSALNASSRTITMAKEAAAAGIRPIICLIASWGPGTVAWVDEYNGYLAAAAATNGWATVDTGSVLNQGDGSIIPAYTLAGDGIHRTQAGNQAEADNFPLGLFGSVIKPSATANDVTLTWNNNTSGGDTWRIERRIIS
ncbi:hypothetical protein HGB25_00255 [Candidatus Saccharibacteria bacterium]|nr:hypothetical protein [Candidatus Saccharibacteria bacterium]